METPPELSDQKLLIFFFFVTFYNKVKTFFKYILIILDI